MTVEASAVHERLATLKKADEDRAEFNTRVSYIKSLNGCMGRDEEVVYFHLTNLARNLAKKFNLKNDSAVETAVEFTRYFQDKKWSKMDPRDIAMMGHLTAGILAPVIMYDERTYTFHYAEDKPMSEVYDELLESWRKLPFWKRLLHRRPEIEVPEHIKKEGS